MDTPFKATDWQPTKALEPGDELDAPELEVLIPALATQTANIIKHPYDPNRWLSRGRTLQQLQYPELALGDAWKALQLCRNLLARLHDCLHDCNDWKLGYGMGFWMREEPERANDDEDEDDDLQSEVLWESLTQLQAEAHSVAIENMYYFPEHDEGRFLQRPYPWMAPRHRIRDDGLIAMLNEEFFARLPTGDGGEARCVVKRHAFGESSEKNDTSDVLGVFAVRDLSQDDTLVVEQSRTWGCNGAGKNGDRHNLHGGMGCSDPLHPNLPSEDVSQDLRWIRDRAGSHAAEVLVRCRFLLCCIEDNVAHPLDHHLVARLTPTYRRDKARIFTLEHDIAIPNEMLQQFGVDIFANPNYDTWVLFTLQARVENNSWSDPIHTCVSPLFSLFNHSCEPNVSWKVQKDHITMILRADRNVVEGEQLFVGYDSFIRDQSLFARRPRLRKWLDDDCQCSRCLREEAELAVIEQPLNVVPEWDVSEKPVLPEDLVPKLKN